MAVGQEFHSTPRDEVEQGSGNQDDDPVSFLKVKESARRMLPPNSTLRKLILAESDKMPRSQLLPKLEIYARLLYQEVNRD